MRIVDLLERNGRLYPSKPAVVIVGGPSLSYAELRHRAVGLATALAGRGVGRGDRVAIMAGNTTTPFDVYLAAAYLGAAAVPINTRLVPPEIAHIVEDAEPAIGVADAVHAEDLASVLPPGVDVVSTAGPDYRRMLEAGEAPGIADRADSSDTALIIYTSGTTGRPKGVCLTQAALCFNAITMAIVQGFTPNTVFMSMTPLYHAATGTRVTSMLVDGQTHVVLPDFSAADALGAIEEHRVTTTIAVPTQLRRILDSPTFDHFDLSSLELVVYGAAPTGSPLIRRAMEQLPCGLYQGYGLSEATTNLTALLPADHQPEATDERLASAGRPVPGATIAIQDEEGRALGPGSVGEVCVRSDKVMAGYWRNPEATADVLVDGWLRTGDLGRFDSEGYLSIVDRAKDMLISGGVNVYPSEIEAVICEWPAVSEVAVVGRPDAEWGEVPVAFVTLDGEALDESAVTDHCRQRLAGLKVPKAVHVVDELPRTATGKVRKVDLRALTTEGAVIDD